MYTTFKNSSIAVVVMCSMLFVLPACKNSTSETKTNQTYYQPIDTGVKTGGIKVIPVHTTKGTLKIWTKQMGNNPTIKVLLLSGGPGSSHEYFECLENFFPEKNIEFIYYDQSGTGNSDIPADTSVYSLQNSVEEVEQVRKALHLDNSNFYLLGHSWGGIVALEYALKYQQNLKSVIISDMMCSADDYNKYAKDVLAKQMDPKVLDTLRTIEERKDFSNPKYMELLMTNYYAKHICRLPVWPEPLTRSFNKINQKFYTIMQGPSEFGLSGKLTGWNRKPDLKKITIPALTIGARYDTMDPEHMKWMATEMKNGSFLYCPNGSHMCLYDDQKIYMQGLIRYIEAIDKGEKKVSL